LFKILSLCGVQLQQGQYSPRTGLPDAVTIMWVHAYTQNDLLFDMST